MPPLPPESFHPLPYDSLAPGELTPLSVNISKRDRHTIFTVVSERGFQTWLVQRMYRLTAEYIRSNNLTYGDAGRLIEFLRDRTDTCSARISSPRDDGAAIEAVRLDAASGSNVPTDLLETSKARRTGKIREAVKRVKSRGEKDRGGLSE